MCVKKNKKQKKQNWGISWDCEQHSVESADMLIL